MEWSCIKDEHKPFTFKDSGREYCKKCGKLLRDYPKEVADALVRDMARPDQPMQMQLWNGQSWGTVEYL